MMKLDVLMTGVGGQGIILSSDVMGEAAMAAGYDVKKTDVHGMAQRGGSVTSHVRIAERVSSPLISEGEADLLLGFEKLEGIRYAGFLKPGGIAIINNHALPPLSVSLGLERYPTDEEIGQVVRQRTQQFYYVPATRLAAELGDVRALNMLLIGCASVFTPFETSVWRDTVNRLVPPKVRELNVAAFELGRKEIQSVRL